MSQYIVTTPKNPGFSGKTCGVRFERGRAFVSKHTIDPGLGWSVEEVAEMMRVDFGYNVTVVEEESLPVAVETVYATVPESVPSPAVDPVALAEAEFKGRLVQAAAEKAAEETPKAARKPRGGK